jgi:hypothetical protein
MLGEHSLKMACSFFSMRRGDREDVMKRPGRQPTRTARTLKFGFILWMLGLWTFGVTLWFWMFGETNPKRRASTARWRLVRRPCVVPTSTTRPSHAGPVAKVRLSSRLLLVLCAVIAGLAAMAVLPHDSEGAAVPSAPRIWTPTRRASNPARAATTGRRAPRTEMSN